MMSTPANGRRRTSKRTPLPSVAVLLEVDSSSVLVQRDQRRSQLGNRQCGTLPLSISLQDGIRFVGYPIPATPSARLTACFPRREDDGFSTFRLSTTDGLGSAFSPVAQHLRRKRIDFPVLATHHFGYSLISIFGCLSITKFIGSSLSLTLPPYSSGLIRRDAGRSSALSQRLYTLPLPATHTLVESDWKNNR